MRMLTCQIAHVLFRDGFRYTSATSLIVTFLLVYSAMVFFTSVTPTLVSVECRVGGQVCASSTNHTLRANAR